MRKLIYRSLDNDVENKVVRVIYIGIKNNGGNKRRNWKIKILGFLFNNCYLFRRYRK